VRTPRRSPDAAGAREPHGAASRLVRAPSLEPRPLGPSPTSSSSASTPRRRSGAGSRSARAAPFASSTRPTKSRRSGGGAASGRGAPPLLELGRGEARVAEALHVRRIVRPLPVDRDHGSRKAAPQQPPLETIRPRLRAGRRPVARVLDPPRAGRPLPPRQEQIAASAMLAGARTCTASPRRARGGSSRERAATEQDSRPCSRRPAPPLAARGRAETLGAAYGERGRRRRSACSGATCRTSPKRPRVVDLRARSAPSRERPARRVRCSAPCATRSAASRRRRGRLALARPLARRGRDPASRTPAYRVHAPVPRLLGERAARAPSPPSAAAASHRREARPRRRPSPPGSSARHAMPVSPSTIASSRPEPRETTRAAAERGLDDRDPVALHVPRRPSGGSSSTKSSAAFSAAVSALGASRPVRCTRSGDAALGRQPRHRARLGRKPARRTARRHAGQIAGSARTTTSCPLRG
jgi:hypothetical protein